MQDYSFGWIDSSLRIKPLNTGTVLGREFVMTVANPALSEDWYTYPENMTGEMIKVHNTDAVVVRAKN